MSYDTVYSLRIINQDVDGMEIIAILREEYGDAYDALEENGNSNNSCKWYDHEDDLCAFSKKFPEVIFELSGEGDEAGDVWKAYFQNGKMQRCQAEMIIPPFDPEKLK